MLKIGHRGAKGWEPENTLASFRKAIDLGVDMVELDVHLKEGGLFVLHDIDRWTLKTPTLREVFDFVDKKTQINVELKGEETALPAAGLIKEYVNNKEWSFGHFLISSFKFNELKNFKKACPEVRLGMLIRKNIPGYLEEAKALKVFSINLPFEMVKKDNKIIAELRREGFRVIVWTVNSPRKIKWLAELGADGICSDYPDRISQLFLEK